MASPVSNASISSRPFHENPQRSFRFRSPKRRLLPRPSAEPRVTCVTRCEVDSSILDAGCIQDNLLQKKAKSRKGLRSQNSIFVFFAAFCKNFPCYSGIQPLFSSSCSLKTPMHPFYEKADKLSSEVIGAAIEVHRNKGPGLIESIYERCMLRELDLRSIPATTQKIVRIEYKGLIFDEPLRFDLLVDDCLLVELRAVEILHPSSKAQLFS